MSSPASTHIGVAAPAAGPDGARRQQRAAEPARWNNFCAAFAAAVERHADRTAAELQRRDTVDAVTYNQLARMAAQARARFVAKGLGRGDRCVILAENDARWCAAFLGILQIGAVAVPLDTNYAAKQVARLVQDSGARLMVASAKMEAVARQAASLAGAPCTVLPLGGGEQEGASDAPPAAAGPAVHEDAAVILYTSGTTSDPKGVVLTHGNLLSELESILRTIWLDERDVLLGVLPLYHALALVQPDPAAFHRRPRGVPGSA